MSKEKPKAKLYGFVYPAFGGDNNTPQVYVIAYCPEQAIEKVKKKFPDSWEDFLDLKTIRGQLLICEEVLLENVQEALLQQKKEAQ